MLLGTECKLGTLVKRIDVEEALCETVCTINVCILEILRLTGDEKVFDFMVLTELEAKILEEDTSKIDRVNFLLEEKVPILRYELMDNFFVANKLFTAGEIEKEVFIDVGTTIVFAPVDTEKMLLGTECKLGTLVKRIDVEEALCETVCTINVCILEILRLTGDEKVFDFMVLTELEAKILEEDTSKIDRVNFLLAEKVPILRCMDNFFANDLFTAGEIENEAFIDVGTTVFALTDTQ